MFTVLGLDGSTDVTGVGLVEFDRGGRKRVIGATALAATNNESNALRARLLRIHETREALAEFVLPYTRHVVGSDFVVAYEQHTWRNNDTSEALSMAAGAYLTIPCLMDRHVYAINPMTAKAAWGGTFMKREEAKPAVVRWARREFNIVLADDQDAIADALAVCVAAWAEWRETVNVAAVRPLFGPGSRKQVGEKR